MPKDKKDTAENEESANKIDGLVVVHPFNFDGKDYERGDHIDDAGLFAKLIEAHREKVLLVRG